MSQVRVHAIITGRVQGVSYRYYASREADALGLTGWVRNLPDGNVEAVFEGPRDVVRQMLDWCHQGPPEAAVSDVQVAWEDPSGEFSDFSIRR